MTADICLTLYFTSIDRHEIEAQYGTDLYVFEKLQGGGGGRLGAACEQMRACTR
jgi:hypothetical protein